MNEDVTKLNIGSGRKKIDGYTNLDGLSWDGNTDIIWDISKTPYPFKDNQIKEIICEEVLEHVSFKQTINVLMEFYRILDVGGVLHLQVPDCGLMMEYYFNGEICNCVPHKDTGDGFKADPNCKNCGGTAKVNPTRWLLSFTGAQKHEYDIHRNIFTREHLIFALNVAQFDDLKWKPNINKLKVKCTK